MPQHYPDIIYSKERIRLCFSEVDSTLDFVLGKVNQPKAHVALEEHIHPNSFEIVYIVKGEQNYNILGTDYLVRSNQLFLTLPNERHSSGNYPEDKSILYYVILPTRLLYSLGFDTAESESLISILMNPSHRVLGGDACIPQILEELITSLQTPHPLQKTVIRMLLIRYLLLVIGCIQNSPSPLPHNLAPILEYIELHITENISIQELSRLTNLSESRFKSCFRTGIGIPPAEYILRQKIQYSKELLTTTSKNITEIAFTLSFSSSQYFSTVFKRFTTLTPAEYRLKHQKLPL